MNTQESGRLNVTPAVVCCVLLLATIIGLVVNMYLSPAISSARQLVGSAACEASLEGVARAIRRYRTTHGALPEHEVLRNGHKHSWRAALADFFFPDNPQASQGLQGGYDFGAPWNSDSNRSSLRAVSSLFNCIEENTSLDYPYTSFVMLLRRSADGNTFISPNALPPKAVLVIESIDSGIETGEPRDIEIADLFDGNGPFGPGRLNSRHEHHVNAMCVDGSVINIPKNISEDELKKLLAGD